MSIRWIGTVFSLLLFVTLFAGLRPPSERVRAEGGFRPGQAAVGEIRGTVTLQLPAEAAPAMLSPYARRRYSPPAPASQASSSPQSVVVYVIVSGRGATQGIEAVISQRNRTIVPAVTAIPKGSRIRFPNEDDVFHNLFSLSGPRPFNLGRYAPGGSKSVRFDTAGVVRVFCDIHSDMSATIVVLDTPFYASPAANGEYVIRGVPEGRHTLVAWHESTGAVRSPIVVTSGGVTRADIRVPS